jgi:hypothetical protein
LEIENKKIENDRISGREVAEETVILVNITKHYYSNV